MVSLLHEGLRWERSVSGENNHTTAHWQGLPLFSTTLSQPKCELHRRHSCDSRRRKSHSSPGRLYRRRRWVDVQRHGRTRNHDSFQARPSHPPRQASSRPRRTYIGWRPLREGLCPHPITDGQRRAQCCSLNKHTRSCSVAMREAQSVAVTPTFMR